MKPQNIGFTKDGTLKLFDFGLAACVKRSEYATDTYELTGSTGTLSYMAPEVALKQPYNEKVDIFSFGMILWKMTSGKVPFAGMNHEEYLERVARGGYRPFIRNDLPLSLKILIEKCWDQNPIFRPSSSEVLTTIEKMINDNSSKPLQELPTHHKSSGSFFTTVFRRKGVRITSSDDERQEKFT